MTQDLIDNSDSRLKAKLLNIAKTDGDFMTDIPAISIHRRSHATDPIPCLYELGLAITVSGKKQVSIGNDIFIYGAGQSLLASVDLPVVAQVIEASEAYPYLGIMLRLDSNLVIKIATQMALPHKPNSGNSVGLSQGSLDEALYDAVKRLISLLDEPVLLKTVAPLIQQEIIARLLAGPHGASFLHLNASGTPQRQIATTMAWLKEHYAESFDIDSLAERAHMSPTTFRHRFKTISGLSPLQYLKQLRLQEARQLMLNHGLDAGASGLRVGYESISQFTREYTRLFGESPSRNVKHLKEQLREEI